MLLLLTEAIKNNPAAKTLELGPPEKEAFIKIKDILAEVSALTHPDPNATQYHLVTDSSNYAVGSALHQIISAIFDCGTSYLWILFLRIILHTQSSTGN